MNPFALLRNTSTAPDAIAWARELVERGPSFSEEERRVLADAWSELAEAPLRDGWDAVVAAECHKQYRQARAALTSTIVSVAGPTPFDERITETEAELHLAEAAEIEARTRLQQVGDVIGAEMRRRRSNEVAPALVEQRQAAQDGHHRADEVLIRLKSRLIALTVARGRWQSEQG